MKNRSSHIKTKLYSAMIKNSCILCRLMWLFILIALLRMKRVISQQGFTLVKHSNMMQPSGKIKQVTVKSISECLQHCLSDCRCSTFDIQERNMDCHLKSHRNETLKAVEGYSHFDIKQVIINHSI